MKKIFLLILPALIIIFAAKHICSGDPKAVAQALLAKAGITINGDKPWDIQVHNEALYAQVLSSGSLALGQAYMDGWWDCQALDQFFYRIARANLEQEVSYTLDSLCAYLKAKIMNLQSTDRAHQVGQQHYDLGNDLFQAMLDKQMIYSCAYRKNAQDLDQAQLNKCALICQKLQLKPGMKLLDIGCGWGGLARYAAEHYGVSVVGITISEEQAEYARHIARGLPVEIRLQDYRSLDETFDRIVSVGMFEHVGVKNYKTFFSVTHRLLAEDGILLLHTIGSNTSLTYGDPWMTTYIFPNGMLPSIEQIAQATQGTWIMEDWHNFGADYDTTLMAWAKNFDRHWPSLQEKYGERFYRMWNYYLLSCAGAFRARSIQLWQIVFSKGLLGGYQSVR